MKNKSYQKQKKYKRCCTTNNSTLKYVYLLVIILNKKKLVIVLYKIIKLVKENHLPVIVLFVFQDLVLPASNSRLIVSVVTMHHARWQVHFWIGASDHCNRWFLSPRRSRVAVGLERILFWEHGWNSVSRATHGPSYQDPVGRRPLYMRRPIHHNVLLAPMPAEWKRIIWFLI